MKNLSSIVYYLLSSCKTNIFSTCAEWPSKLVCGNRSIPNTPYSIRFSIVYCLTSIVSFSQNPFPTNTSIHKDSALFTAWGASVEVLRGKIHQDSTTVASAGMESNALNSPDGLTVSLGEHGTATYTLDQPLFNGPGADFAVFENSFNATFLELAKVAVSSDGINFFSFPPISATQDSLQIGTFGAVNPANLHQLAGKYPMDFGTPFDLEHLPSNFLLNKNNISHIKIIDVVGDIENPTLDSENRAINDPYPTAFASCGFDLDAIGFIHVSSPLSLYKLHENSFKLYPNPVSSRLTIEGDFEWLEILDARGRTVFKGKDSIVDVSNYDSGFYTVRIVGSNYGVQSKKLWII